MAENTHKTAHKSPTGADLMSNTDIANFLTGVKPITTTAQSPQPIQVEMLRNKDETVEETVENAKPLSAKEKYEEVLKEHDLTIERAAVIIDQMLFKGVYEEDVPVSKKLTVRFRTRDQAAMDRLHLALNNDAPQFNSSVLSIAAKYHLAASLIRYGQYEFDPKDQNGFEETMKFICRLPLPVYNIIVEKLAKFDAKLAAIVTDDAVNFI